MKYLYKMSMTSDKAEWYAFAIWVDHVAVLISFGASGSTFDSVITEELSSPDLLLFQLKW